MNERDKLFNALIEAVAQHGKSMEIGLVRAVLQEVDGVIAQGAGRLPFERIQDKLEKRGCPTDAGTSAGQNENQ